MFRGLTDMMPGFSRPPMHSKMQGQSQNGLEPSAFVSAAFRVPFTTDLPGPDTEDIVHATKDAVERWTHPQNVPDDVPVHQLPVYAGNLERLQRLCEALTAKSHLVEANVITTYLNGNAGPQITTVCLNGALDAVQHARRDILQQVPVSLHCTAIDVDGGLFYDHEAGALKKDITNHLDLLSAACGVDVFLLGPKLTPVVDDITGDSEMRVDRRWRIAIYGDLMATEYAKTRILAKIDELLGRIVDIVPLDHTLQQGVCGRHRRNIKSIEASTGTAIYFSPPFSEFYSYTRPGAQKRNLDSVIITGERMDNIVEAKRKLHEIVSRTRTFVLDTVMESDKIDSIMLGNLDAVRKIAEANAAYVMFPLLGGRQSVVRIQAGESHCAQRTGQEIMRLATQYYGATWLVNQPDPRCNPAPAELVSILVKINVDTGSDIMFDSTRFQVTGSDEAVKAALAIISEARFVSQPPTQIQVKIELANEHKEFVSGKKNGKINKIMGQSHAQVMFHNFSEMNFIIEVSAGNYQSLVNGLQLVERELPAEISFHVPDQYHKRIIGIGGQHIQRIMKKHFVYVKFSNAMEMGFGRDDGAVKVDNVVCRTPARNADCLELVKNEIFEIVDRDDSDFTSQVVNVDRLLHRKLIVRVKEIEALENEFQCKIEFPNTEQASDEVKISGAQWQVPRCVDGFLSMVPDKHELVLARSDQLMKFLESPEFVDDMVPKLRTQHEVDLVVVNGADDGSSPPAEDSSPQPPVTLRWTFTRNNAGGLRDAIDFLQSHVATAGIDIAVIRGSIPRPKSDSFSESFPYFESKLLQPPTTQAAKESPAKSAFEEVAREKSTFLDRLRKPGSMSSISSFLDRRKNSSQSAVHFFQGSNVSRSSLVSLESTRSFNADRNPWNDSGVNLADDDSHSILSVTRRPGSSLNDSKLMATHHTFSPGDATPRHNAQQSTDSGRPSTSHSTASGYPGPRGPLH